MLQKISWFVFFFFISLPIFSSGLKEAAGISLAKDVDVLWVMVSASLVFFMQAGFLMLETGLVRSKNTINVAIKNLVDYINGTVAFFLLGYGLMFGLSESGLYGSSLFMLDGLTTPQEYTFFFFQVTFMGTSATIVSGAIAERVRFPVYILVSTVVSIFIYPIFGHWSWGGGWLSDKGFVDFAGSTVVHSIGGWVALAGVITLGARKGKFDEKTGKPRRIYGHNLASAVLGTMILWFGWIGFNGGSTLKIDDSMPIIVVNTFMAASFSGVMAGTISWGIYRVPLVEDIINGVLGGLVAITAACHVVSPISACIIGVISGIVVVLTTLAMDYIFKLDDVVSAFPVHGVCGIWGTLAVALFAKDGVQVSFWVQLIGVLTAGVWAFGIGFLLFWVLKYTIKIRVSKEDEKMGLNITEHGAKTTLLDLINTMDLVVKNKDFTQKVEIDDETESGIIAEYFNQFIIEFSRILIEVKNNAENLDKMSKDLEQDSLYISKDVTLRVEEIVHFTNLVRDMNNSIQSIIQMANSQNKEIDRAKILSNSLSQGFKNIDRSLEQATIKFSDFQDLTKKNEEELHNTVNGIYYIKKDTDNVSKLVQIINDISKQLHMLAINASIEAEKSGEYGQGFSVVAGEISKLSEKTANSSFQAFNYLNEIQKNVKHEVNDIQKVVKTFQLISKDVKNWEKIFNQLRELGLGYSKDVDKIQAFIRKITDSNSTLLTTMQNQQQEVNQFSNEMNILNTTFSELQDRSLSLHNTSNSLQTKSKFLYDLVIRFKTNTIYELT